MNRDSGSSADNGKAVGASLIASAVVGAIGAAVFGKKETRQEAARRQIDQRVQHVEALAGQSFDRVSKALEQVRSSAPVDRKTTGKNAAKLKKSTARSADEALKQTRQRIKDIDREARKLQAIERANKLGSDGSAYASDVASMLGSRTSSLFEETRGMVPAWRSRASKTAEEMRGKGSNMAKHAAKSAPDTRERVIRSTAGVSALASGLLNEARKRGAEVNVDSARTATKRMREKAPVVKTAATKAAQTASEKVAAKSPELKEAAAGLAAAAGGAAAQLLDQAREKAPDVVDSVTFALHSAQERATPIVAQAKEATRHAAEDLAPEIKHRAEDVSGKVQQQGSNAKASLTHASERLSGTTDALGTRSKDAVSAAGSGSKEAGALLVWAGAAAGVAFYAFLNDDQRQKVMEAAGRIVGEVRDVYMDIRGYDGDFT